MKEPFKYVDKFEDKYTEMVAALRKPGEAIRSELTAWDCDFIHMGGCLMGEAAELYEALTDPLKGNRSELVKECGDFLFYLVGTSQVLDAEWYAENYWGPTSIIDPKLAQQKAVELMKLCGDFWDVVKRVTIYRKQLHEPDKKFNGDSLGLAASELLSQIDSTFMAMLSAIAIDIEEVVRVNMEKLADPKKGRYASGKYSDAQAQNRNDEKP